MEVVGHRENGRIVEVVGHRKNGRLGIVWRL